jgi:hypothetical protein
LDIGLYVDGYLGRWGAILRQMKALEFFGFVTNAGGKWYEPNHESIFEYLRPILSALPPRLGGLEIGTWYWSWSLAEVRITLMPPYIIYGD